MSKQRLIDANALIEKHGDWYTEEGTEEGYIGTIKGIVNRMPTIEERKTGKWRCVSKLGEMFKGYRCSECAELVYGKTNFCPHCGADMRGEEDG